MGLGGLSQGWYDRKSGPWYSNCTEPVLKIYNRNYIKKKTI